MQSPMVSLSPSPVGLDQAKCRVDALAVPWWSAGAEKDLGNGCWGEEELLARLLMGRPLLTAEVLSKGKSLVEWWPWRYTNQASRLAIIAAGSKR